MAISITSKENLKQIFDKVNRAYYFDNANAALSEQTSAIELPVLENGVTFDTGAAELNEVKLTDGTTWTSKASQGDSDISFQVSSVHATISSLFMEQKASSMSGDFDGYTYSGSGYSLAPKKVTGALLLLSEDKTTGIYLPNIECYASFNGEGGDDSTGYYNVVVTPLTDTSGASFYPLLGSKKA